MAAWVISWNTIRFTGTLGLRYSSRCHEIASPSRSSSVARYSSEASFSAALRSFTTCLPRSVSSYVGLKPLSTSMFRPLLGRSATWPTEARTSKLLPRNFEIVLALAGDSTTTRGFAIGASGYGMAPCLVKAGCLPERYGHQCADAQQGHRTVLVGDSAQHPELVVVDGETPAAAIGGRAHDLGHPIELAPPIRGQGAVVLERARAAPFGVEADLGCATIGVHDALEASGAHRSAATTA